MLLTVWNYSHSCVSLKPVSTLFCLQELPICLQAVSQPVSFPAFAFSPFLKLKYYKNCVFLRYWTCFKLWLCSGLNQGKFYPSDEESLRRSSYGEGLASVVQNGENLTEWGKTSPSGDSRWGHTSVSDTWAMSTAWNMQLDSTGDKGCRYRACRLDQSFTLAEHLNLQLPLGLLLAQATWKHQAIWSVTKPLKGVLKWDCIQRWQWLLFITCVTLT